MRTRRDRGAAGPRLVDSSAMDVVRCPGCGEENPSRFRLCGYCGTSLDAARRRVGLVSRVRLREPGRVPVLRLLRDGPRPPAAAGPGGPPGDPMHGGHPGAPGYGLPPWAWWAVRWAPPWSPPGGYGAPTPPGWPAPPPGWGAPPPAGVRRLPAGASRRRRIPGIRRPAIRRPAHGRARLSAARLGRPAARMGTARRLEHAAGGIAACRLGSACRPAAPVPAADPAAARSDGRRPRAADGRAAATTAAGHSPHPGRPGSDRCRARARVRTGAAVRRAAVQPSIEGPSAAPPQPAAPPPPSDAGRPASATPAAFPGFEAVAAPATLPSQEIRKVVTIIFSDLKGSTALTERIDAEAINEVKERYFASMAAEITRHGGKIEKYIGDAIMAVFGLPASPRGRRPAGRPGGLRHDPGDGATERRPARGLRRRDRGSHRRQHRRGRRQHATRTPSSASPRATPSTWPRGSSRPRRPTRSSSAR